MVAPKVKKPAVWKTMCAVASITGSIIYGQLLLFHLNNEYVDNNNNSNNNNQSFALSLKRPHLPIPIRKKSIAKNDTLQLLNNPLLESNTRKGQKQQRRRNNMQEPVQSSSQRNKTQSLTKRSPSILLTTGTKSAPVIAYVISLIKCGDRQSSTAGLIDAALVLRHSVHLQSIRNTESRSKYDYQMYAIVHSNALECSQILKTVGELFQLG